jgi:type I restriction enzyme M protein
MRASRRLPGRRQLRAEQVDLCAPKVTVARHMVAPLHAAGQPYEGSERLELERTVRRCLEARVRGVAETYARPGLDVRRLGELVDLISGIGLGAAEHREKDILGRVYEYFLGRFGSAEAKGGGKFYTPRSVVKLLVEMIEPYSGTTR